MLRRLVRIPRDNMRIAIRELRRLPADCQTRILDGLPEWQQTALQSVLGRRVR